MWAYCPCGLLSLLSTVEARDRGRSRGSGVLPGTWEVAGRGMREEARFHTCLFLEGLLCFLLSTQMKKVMLTVFKHNHGAYQFFREALQ